MRYQQIKRATSLLAAAVYLLAIALSSLSHVHVHALGDASHGSAHSDHCAGHAHAGDHADADQLAVDNDCDHHDADDDAAQPAGHSPTSHEDDCNICQFLGRPILAVTPFELAETSEHVVPVPADAMPDVQPIVVVATQARAPPGAASSI
jgi:hypothetical protein